MASFFTEFSLWKKIKEWLSWMVTYTLRDVIGTFYNFIFEKTLYFSWVAIRSEVFIGSQSVSLLHELELSFKFSSHDDTDAVAVSCMTLFKIQCYDVKCRILFTSIWECLNRNKFIEAL